MITMPGNVEQETIILDNGNKQVITYLTENGDLEEKYDLDAFNMLIQTYDSNGVLVNEELKENPYRGKYEESEHWKEFDETVKKTLEDDEKQGTNTL
jgi:hypothetical protein